MTHDGRLDEWIKELENKSFQNNTFDRRAFIQHVSCQFPFRLIDRPYYKKEMLNRYEEV